jgi:hypothetical protein
VFLPEHESVMKRSARMSRLQFVIGKIRTLRKF